MMIESGTHLAGIAAADFGLPRGTALRYERPAEALRHLFPSYAVLDSDVAMLDPDRRDEWMLPTCAQIWIVLTAGPIHVRIGNRSYSPLGSAVLYGVTSRAMPTRANGGLTVAIDVSPLGWARLFDADAESFRDRITPLETVLPAEWIEELVTNLHASDRALDVKDVLDTFFLRHLPDANPDEPMVASIMHLLTEDDISDLPAVAARVGITVRTLRRMTKRYFGFPPTTLLIRTRLLKTVIRMLTGGKDGDASSSPKPYFDASHCNRDGRRFLGMTPRRFASLNVPYLRAALRARHLVIGAAIAPLDRIGTVEPAPTRSVRVAE